MPIYPRSGNKYLTEDATTWITRIDGSRISYENTDGDRWYIDGTCNACGACEVNGDGSLRQKVARVEGKVIGEPGAVVEQDYETRRDIPVRPNLTWELKSRGCVLSGEYTRTSQYTPPDRR